MARCSRMPFVDGESLRDRLEREKQLPIDYALRSRGRSTHFQHAHNHGVIRDIKPEHIPLQGRLFIDQLPPCRSADEARKALTRVVWHIESGTTVRIRH